MHNARERCTCALWYALNLWIWNRCTQNVWQDAILSYCCSITFYSRKFAAMGNLIVSPCPEGVATRLQTKTSRERSSWTYFKGEVDHQKVSLGVVHRSNQSVKRTNQLLRFRIHIIYIWWWANSQLCFSLVYIKMCFQLFLDLFAFRQCFRGATKWWRWILRTVTSGSGSVSWIRLWLPTWSPGGTSRTWSLRWLVSIGCKWQNWLKVWSVGLFVS